MPSTTASISWSGLRTSDGLGDALGPGEFGDVDEAFDARFEFHKRAVGHEVDDLALDLGADRDTSASMLSHGLAIFCLRPRLTRSFSRLMSSTTTSISWPTLSSSRGMADAAPAHVGDVEQAVDAVEVDERAEIGDVLDGALADVARGHFGEELLAAFGAFLLDEFAAGEDDVLALLVDLDDLEFVGVADELREVLGRDDVDLRSRAGTPRRRC